MTRRDRRLRLTGLALAGAVLGAAACGAGGGPSETLTVFAAASLTDAFGELAERFEADHPDIDVQLSVAGSSSLREQILDGAPADVFASADASIMEELVAADAAIDPAPFATNRLQIAVPAGNPAGVTGLADFADADLLLGLCADEVPCGDFARRALTAAGVEPSVDTEEPDVRALLTKVEAGELDAGIVYVSDVESADGSVEGIDIAAPHDVVATYPIAVTAVAPNPQAAGAFVELVMSPAGGRILEAHGFGPP